MKILIIFSFFIFGLTGCFGKDQKLELANTYWRALVEDNDSVLNDIVKTVDDDLNIGYLGDMPIILDDVNENGVQIKISRYCFPDIISTTYIDEVDGVLKVDHLKTISILTRMKRLTKTNKQYCYDFHGHPMKGKIGGKEWIPIKLVQEDYFGSKVDVLYSVDAEKNINTGELYPKVILFNFNHDDPKNNSGNFTDYTVLSMFISPGNNLGGLGSFRVTDLTDDNYKLEITYEHDKENYVSGYLIVNKRK
ncbi:hypothetical protein ACKOZO_004292 [Vibrio vulnificus]|nr:hypothetical protein [Vibrio vulnificus]